MKAWFGKSATKENNWCYDWLPKLDMPGAGYDVLRYFDMMYQGKVNGYFCQGFQPHRLVPQQGQGRRCAGAPEVDGGDGPAGDRDLRSSGATSASTTTSTPPASRPRCSACPPPASPRKTARSSTAAAGCSGTGRAPSRRARRVRTSPSWPGCSTACARCTAGTAGPSRPDPRPRLVLPLKPDEPGPDELAREFNGKALSDLVDPANGMILAKAGEQLPASPCCATTAARRAAAGSSPAPDPAGQPDGPPRQQRPLRHGPTSAGPGPGRRTGGFSTTAPRPTSSAASRGTRRRSAWCGGTASPGAAPTCPTTRPTDRRKPG